MARADGTIDVYLISGFLGSGKTTFLNRLIKVVPEDLTFLILMNEFGEVGLDGTLVEGDDVDMFEISKGSIFCACVKTDFIKALHELAKTVRPDIMLIETTGVANPSDLDRDLKLPIFGGAFQLRDKFCLVDAENFLDTYESFLAIEKQLASSDVFIINKIDLVTPEVVAEIRAIVESFNPDPVFYEATYAEVPFGDLFRQGGLSGRVRDVASRRRGDRSDGGNPGRHDRGATRRLHRRTSERRGGSGHAARSPAFVRARVAPRDRSRFQGVARRRFRRGWCGRRASCVSMASFGYSTW